METIVLTNEQINIDWNYYLERCKSHYEKNSYQIVPSFVKMFGYAIFIDSETGLINIVGERYRDLQKHFSI